MAAAGGGGGGGAAGAAPPQLAAGMAGVAAAVEGMSRVELLAVATQMRALAAQSEADARTLLLQFPSLTAALLMIEERLGMLKTTTPALDAAAAAAGPAADAGAEAGSPAAAADDGLAVVRGILQLTDAAVSALPDDQRESALTLRQAILLPLDVLHGFAEPRRSQLLELREQLRGMGITPA